MSLVKIVHHNENIYDILNKPPPEPPKTPRYESQLEKELKAKKTPQLALTFGYAEVPLKKPEEFLKKGEGLYPPVKRVDHKCFKGNLPPVPRRPPPGPKKEKPKKNYAVLNIKRAIKAKPRPIQQRLVDSRNGHIKRIQGSGEVPEYCKLPGFGKLPNYLIKRNERLEKEREKFQHMEEVKENICQLISEEDRKKLLADLKHNWYLLQKAFLQLPVVTDTIPKILKKDKMDRELRQLEKDIALVENNPFIYVYDH